LISIASIFVSYTWERHQKEMFDFLHSQKKIMENYKAVMKYMIPTPIVVLNKDDIDPVPIFANDSILKMFGTNIPMRHQSICKGFQPKSPAEYLRDLNKSLEKIQIVKYDI